MMSQMYYKVLFRSNGDRREDIHNIFNPIKKAGGWFDINNKDINTIFK